MILEMHNNTPEIKDENIAQKVGCSLEMVKYVLGKRKRKACTNTKITPKRLRKQEQINLLLSKYPEKTTMEIAQMMDMNYQTAIKYIKNYYKSLQILLWKL